MDSGDTKSQLEDSWQIVEQLKDAAVHSLRENAFRYHTIILNAAREIQGLFRFIYRSSFFFFYRVLQHILIVALQKGLQELKSALVEEQNTLEGAIEAPNVYSTKNPRRK